MTTHYEVLGIAPDATPEQVGVAYQRAMAAATAPGATHDVEQARTEINRAYATLSDLRRRYAYDMELFAPGSVPTVQPRGAPHIRDPRVLGIAIAAAIVGLLGTVRVIGAVWPAGGEKTTADLRIGDCFDRPVDVPRRTEDGSVVSVVTVPCSRPHDNEVYAILTLPGAEGAPFPGVDEVRDQTDAFCRQEFEEFIGIGFDRSRYDILMFSPSAESWAVGRRRIVCNVYYRAGPVTGSLRGIAQ